MSKIQKAFNLWRAKGLVSLTQESILLISREIARARFIRRAKSVHIISAQQRELQRNTTFQNPVTFSIITPIYNTPGRYLTELLDSLYKQTYSNWELCLVDASDMEHQYVGEFIRKNANKDKRIKYKKIDENLGISGNSNECIKMASGEYIGLLDHDDILHESALFEMMKSIEAEKADFLYSDEVKFLDKIENAVDFNFKPGFGKDELRSHNYICHFTVFKKSLLNEVGMYRPEFDGSQDHDMVLRLTEKAKKIVHIPKVLYYWRLHPHSVSMDLDSKSYAVDAAIKAVQQQLYRTGEFGEVTSNLPYRTIYRIHYKLNANYKVHVLIHGVNSWKDALEIQKELQNRTNYKRIQFVPVFCKQNENIGKKWNDIIRQSDADYFVLIDAKCMPVCSEWIEEMLMYAQRKDVCAVSPMIYFCNDRVAYAGVALDHREKNKIRFVHQGTPKTEQGYEAMLRHVRNITSVWRGCCMFSKDIWFDLGGFSESLHGYEEIDFSLKGRDKNYWNIWTCFSEIQYDGCVIPKNIYKGKEEFEEKWYEILKREDEFCNHNLIDLQLI